MTGPAARVQRRRCRALMPVLTAALLLPAALDAGEANWLQLDQDQREARREAGPMTPNQERRLQTRERQESMQLRQTLEDQRTSLDALARERRRGLDRYAQPAVRDPGAFGLQMDQARELEVLRLRQDLQRRSEGTPPGLPGAR